MEPVGRLTVTLRREIEEAGFRPATSAGVVRVPHAVADVGVGHVRDPGPADVTNVLFVTLQHLISIGKVEYQRAVAVDAVVSECVDVDAGVVVPLFQRNVVIVVGVLCIHREYDILDAKLIDEGNIGSGRGNWWLRGDSHTWLIHGRHVGTLQRRLLPRLSRTLLRQCTSRGAQSKGTGDPIPEPTTVVVDSVTVG